MVRPSTSSQDLKRIRKVRPSPSRDIDDLVNRGPCLVAPLKKLKRKRSVGLTVHELLKLELDHLTHAPPQVSGKENFFLMGDLGILLSIRDEIHRNLQAVNTDDPNAHQDSSSETRPLFVSSFVHFCLTSSLTIWGL